MDTASQEDFVADGVAVAVKELYVNPRVTSHTAQYGLLGEGDGLSSWNDDYTDRGGFNVGVGADLVVCEDEPGVDAGEAYFTAEGYLWPMVGAVVDNDVCGGEGCEGEVDCGGEESLDASSQQNGVCDCVTVAVEKLEVDPWISAHSS